MPRRLFVYGDSFADPLDTYTREYRHESWPVMVGEARNATAIHNSGCGGSGIAYSLNKFVDDIERIKPGDDVIFIVSGPDRLDLEHVLDSEQAHIAATYRAWLTDPVANKFLESPWLKNNKAGLEWYVLNRSMKVAEIYANSAVHMLRNYAEQNPAINVLVMYIYPGITKFVPIPQNSPKNFFLQQEVTLFQISDSEYFDEIPRNYDFRLNHLTQLNAHKLANLIVEAFEKGNKTQWRATDFHQKILLIPKTLKEYKELVNNGLVVYMDYYVRNFLD